MRKISELLLIMVVFMFLTACSSRNQYGVPKKQWEKASKSEQALIEQSNQPMKFAEDN